MEIKAAGVDTERKRIVKLANKLSIDRKREKQVEER